MAVHSIFSFGPQGELLLIEGLTKDKNPVIRTECAKGLSIFGPHTFRALIFGLRDTEETVRTATANALRKTFSPQDVIHEFGEKHHQKPAIICAIKEILNLQYYYGKETRQFLEEILNYFQNEINLTKSQDNTTLTTTLNGTITSPQKNLDTEFGQNNDYAQINDNDQQGYGNDYGQPSEYNPHHEDDNRKSYVKIEDGEPARQTFNDFKTFQRQMGTGDSDNKSQKSYYSTPDGHY